jgi:hypothetical protein
MIQRHRINTNVGGDKKITVELKQDYDFLEILSLRFTQQDVYASLCADYGVICGRIVANNGLGIPNAKVSIFVPQLEEDSNDPVISVLYPYKTIEDKDEFNYRYNLLPQRKQHPGHEPTGTFPDQIDILTREEVLEVYEKYYSFTVKTNESGDFMIWGVPLGEQTIHVDVDMSDIGCFSLRPNDYIRKGFGVDDFKSSYEFKASPDIDSLPQITSFNKTITVYPFWGNEDFCEIGISRVDFDLSSQGVKIEPMAYFIGSIFTDSGKIRLTKDCVPDSNMGTKCKLITGTATIEAIRFTNELDSLNRPILELYELTEDVDEDGTFMFQLPMNMEYVYTDEYGDNQITNDSNKGVATSAVYRFRITMNGDTNNTKKRTLVAEINRKTVLRSVGAGALTANPFFSAAQSIRVGGKRTLASYLVPNIREYNTTEEEKDKSYTFSIDWNDYPTGATNSNVIFNNEMGKFYPQDYFYRFNYNKVYTLSSFMGSYFNGQGAERETFLGLKNITPKVEDDCESSIVTPPVNFGTRKSSFAILLATVLNIFERIILLSFIGVIQVLIIPFQALRSFRIFIPPIFKRNKPIIDWWPFNPEQNKIGKITIPVVLDVDKYVIEPLQIFGTLKLGIVTYPECEECSDVDGEVDITEPNESTQNAKDVSELFASVMTGVLFPDTTYTTIIDNGVKITDSDPNISKLYLTVPEGINPRPVAVATNGVTIIDLINDPNRYFIRLNGEGYGERLHIFEYYYNNQTYYYVENTVYDFINVENNDLVPFEIYDSQESLFVDEVDGEYSTTIISDDLPTGCNQYRTLYDETIVGETYCIDEEQPYNTLSRNDLVSGYGCSGGKLIAGQTIKAITANPCNTCITKSGYSEFRNGSFTIIPATNRFNRRANRKAIFEYSKRKLIGKLFCEGVTNYSFMDNWLSGTLYFFPFESIVKWNDEPTFDLNFFRTSYCEDLLYFKVKDKRFYYKSTYFDGTNFLAPNTDSPKNNLTYYLNANQKFVNSGTLGHPTTIVDLGPRDEFIKDICLDASLDPNSSVVRNLGTSSYQNFKDMYGLYINYKMDTYGLDGNLRKFFNNDGFNNKIPFKLKNRVLNGDILQLISMNNEVGIEEFSLLNKKYAVYNPTILDQEQYPEFFKATDNSLNGPLPMQLQLDDDGYRIRTSLNEPGRLTESSQNIPFYLWDKKGDGFGLGESQSWKYSTFTSPINITAQPLQGMTLNYAHSLDESYPYVLYPITKEYTGQTISLNNIEYVRISNDFNIEYLNEINGQLSNVIDNTHLNYNNQEEGFTFLYVTDGDGTLSGATEGKLYTRVGEIGNNWVINNWTNNIDYFIKPTSTNYNGNLQILSTPFMFYFGLKPGKTAIDKFINQFGPLGSFTTT